MFRAVNLPRSSGIRQCSRSIHQRIDDGDRDSRPHLLALIRVTSCPSDMIIPIETLREDDQLYGSLGSSGPSHVAYLHVNATGLKQSNPVILVRVRRTPY